MPDSMTGFGRALSNIEAGKIIVEIQSVNRKYLEVFVSVPKEYSRFEHEVRKWVSERIGRGQVSVRVHLVPGMKSFEALLPDKTLLLELKKRWQKLAKQLGYNQKTIDLSFLMQQMPLQADAVFADEKDLPSLRQCVEEALASLLQMKRKEGKALAQDLAKRLAQLQKNAGAIKALAPDAANRMQSKLRERLEEVVKQKGELEEKLFREVALFAEKIDITEELTRLYSHFEQFEELLNPKAKSVGRKMDFLIQEMGREINTVSSKSADAKITRIVVEMKSDLEKMREQVQNIE